ncbi:GH25 family lysozyme [Diplocloster modestus]|uniref:Peptidoglycan binding-like domain-containing protein n=1 Tax=Diplocloster modestus TaxID=2850322 RepID=A0ABS6KFB7_9FIRM|nr:GH25 family lysozyme [Diplocloster modestus]MBU9729174.1 hypothetical protein [Diplocloster modestus]
MSKFGVDVSDNQDRIIWPEVAEGGVQFAILRTVRGSGKTDYQFEANYTGCQDAGIPIGGYKYSYATSVTQARSEADQVVTLLAGRKLELPIWFDMEDKCQRGLSRGRLADIANIFISAIRTAGYQAGIYCNLDWYKNVLPVSSINTVDWWIARYGSNNGRAEERFKPSISGMSGWQYTSRGRVPGISGNVDCNILYRAYTGIGSGNTDMVIPSYGLKYSDTVESFQFAANCDGYRDQNGKPLTVDGLKGNKTDYVAGQILLKAGIYSDGWYRVGSEGVMVNWIQIRMNELIGDQIIDLLGHLMTEDGRFGNDTRLAVGLWQEIQNLKVDYICGSETITRLL